jgi:hypothetical protein
MPAENVQWNESQKEVMVAFEGDNPAASRVIDDSMRARRYETGFVSTHGLMSRLTGVELRSHQFSGDQESRPNVMYVTIYFEAVKHEHV